MSVFPPTATDLVPALTEALDAGHGVVMVLIEFDGDGDGDVAERLALRTTPVSTLALHQIATFLLEQTIVRARGLADGSGGRALPHLDDALRSLQAAFAALDDAQPAPPTIGRA
ncbi:hypothetical protein [Pinisolibacter sp.]|uniref:hypothetical protein n=1 Tax=Pinisolibacter sp. TaxID=2172024 RepID=UPI002FDDEFC5